MSTIAGRSAALLLALVAACGAPYRAQPLDERGAASRHRASRFAAAGEIALGLAEAQSLAVLQNPTLQSLRASRGLADATDVWAELSPDPSISLVPLWAIPDAVLAGFVALRWELLPAGTRDARRGLAAALRSSIDGEVAAAEWSVAQDARVAWIDLVRSERFAAATSSSLALANEARDVGRRRVDANVATGGELALLEVDRAEAERDAVAAASALGVARERLSRIVGLPPGSRVEPRPGADPLEPLDPSVPAGDVDELLLARNPRLRELRSRYDLAERQLELACIGAAPRVTIGPDLQRDNASTYIGGGLSITIPINDANRGAIAEAVARRTIAEKEFEAELYRAQSEIVETRREFDRAAAALRVHIAEVEPRAADAFAQAERGLAAGATGLLDVVLARKRVADATNEGVLLRAARAVAVARLEAAYGPEPPPPQSAPATKPKKEDAHE